MPEKRNNSKKINVVICDPLSETGTQILQSQGFQLTEAIKATPQQLKQAVRYADAVIVRSGTKLTADIINAAENLRIIGRAGVGVDNVDVEAASKKGVIVVNTPSGNTISAAEHTMSLMLAMARYIAPAHQSMCAGNWDRKKFTGVELFEKTLGLIGLGRIGAEVAKRAQSFGMRVVAYDPFLRAEKARELGVSQVSLEDVFKESDFISMHVPLTAETRNIINTDAIKLMKRGVRIVNCARGGLIEEAAATKALNEGQIAGLALDVYEEEPPPKSKLLDHPNVLKTPHLGASTEEAQLKVAVDVAKTVVDYLTGKGLRNAVNALSIDPEILKEMEPYLQLTEKIGKLQGQLVEGQLLKVEIRYIGKVAAYPKAPLTAAYLKGLLSKIMADDVNVINSTMLAKERGIKVVVSETTESNSFSNLIRVHLKSAKSDSTVGGSVYGPEDHRIVLLDDLRLEFKAQGNLLIIENRDVPGMVGQVGTALGKNRINIADMSVGRSKAKKRAKICINVDGRVADSVLAHIRKSKNILNAKFIQL